MIVQWGQNMSNKEEKYARNDTAKGERKPFIERGVS